MGDKKGVQKWNPWEMFDVTDKEKKVIEKRAKIRHALKAEWQKKFFTIDHKPTGFGGSGCTVTLHLRHESTVYTVL